MINRCDPSHNPIPDQQPEQERKDFPLCGQNATHPAVLQGGAETVVPFTLKRKAGILLLLFPWVSNRPPLGASIDLQIPSLSPGKSNPMGKQQWIQQARGELGEAGIHLCC